MPVNKFENLKQDGRNLHPAVSENLFEDFASANTVSRTIKIIVIRF